MNKKSSKSSKIKRTTFGDFQTPLDLAKEVCRLLLKKNIHFKSIIEPNCGVGSFIRACADIFPDIEKIIGVDINAEHLNSARQKFSNEQKRDRITFIQHDFFCNNWEKLLKTLPEPVLIIGNPPWVTNSQLSTLGSNNRPQKSNFQNFKGLDAITGKSNFDISEWMLNKELEWISGKNRTLAMLCKTSVARKVLLCAWNKSLSLSGAEIYEIDAAKHFSVAVDAGFLVVQGTDKKSQCYCNIYKSLRQNKAEAVIGYSDKRLIADMNAFRRRKHLEGKSPYQWRSGIKHDCAQIMELIQEDNHYRNGAGELVNLEPDYIYPMLKGSQIANGSQKGRCFSMLVTQHHPGDETASIRYEFPKTWQYLIEHGELLDRRASSIYKNRPRFSIFGVGDYSFAEWKVAISGFYKKLDFKVIGPNGGKPVVLDDTCYFLPCQCQEEAVLIADLYNSDIAKEFFSAFIFWDEKRPINMGILKRLNLLELSKELERYDELMFYLNRNKPASNQTYLFSQPA